MEMSVSPQMSQKMNLQTPRKSSLSGSKKDMWFAIREGSLVDVDSALSMMKKSGGNINLRNAYGLTPLHIAVWRNHIPIVRRLLAAGADPDARVCHFSSLCFFSYSFQYASVFVILFGSCAICVANMVFILLRIQLALCCAMSVSGWRIWLE